VPSTQLTARPPSLQEVEETHMPRTENNEDKNNQKLPEEDRAENARPVPSQAEGDEETIDEALEKQATR
jgi:hypothetical protein